MINKPLIHAAAYFSVGQESPGQLKRHEVDARYPPITLLFNAPIFGFKPRIFRFI
jgi:hypothetical protein